MINYYFIYNPFHLYYSKIIIEQHFKNEKNILINHSDLNSTKRIINKNTISIDLRRNLIKRIYDFRKIKKDIVKGAINGKNINIFIPHTLGVLSNYSYYVLSKKYNNINLNIFYEGLIFFYSYYHGFKRYYKQNIIYFCVGLLSGTYYTIKAKLLDLNCSRINKIYSPFMNIKAQKEKIIITNLEKISYVPNYDRCIIIGSPLNDYSEIPSRLITSIYQQISCYNINEIYFKDHPRYKCKSQFLSIANELNLSIKTINTILPIETIINVYKPKYVFSFLSSSLINLRNMLAQDINIICVIPKRNGDKIPYKEFSKIFSNLDISVIYK